jgi:predicted DNA-binding protein (UPF0251 family)
MIRMMLGPGVLSISPEVQEKRIVCTSIMNTGKRIFEKRTYSMGYMVLSFSFMRLKIIKEDSEFAFRTYVHYICQQKYSMARPQDNRMVHEPPLFTHFKPTGIKGRELEEIFLTLDEFEAVRLADYKGFSHAEAADEMEISRSTFTRLIEKSRKKIASMIIEGKLLSIDGGSIHFRKNILQCQDCGHMFKINISAAITKCPACESGNLINLAGGFGHGLCCH